MLPLRKEAKNRVFFTGGEIGKIEVFLKSAERRF